MLSKGIEPRIDPIYFHCASTKRNSLAYKQIRLCGRTGELDVLQHRNLVSAPSESPWTAYQDKFESVLKT